MNTQLFGEPFDIASGHPRGHPSHLASSWHVHHMVEFISVGFTRLLEYKGIHGRSLSPHLSMLQIEMAPTSFIREIHTPLTKLLGVKVPILLAPMSTGAGGALAAQVAKYGGFAFIPAGASQILSPFRCL